MNNFCLEFMRRAGLAVVAALVFFGSFGAAAQVFPSKPVRVVLPYSAGSGPDSVLRQLGAKLTQTWGQAVVVDNKPGANGWLAIAEAKRAASDGYTLLALDSTHAGLQPLLYKQLPFDLGKDFEALAPLYSTWFFVVVAADSPWKNLADLLAAARTKPGGLSYGSSGTGSVPHVGAAMLEAATDVRMTHVPYKDFQQIYADVATGRLDWAFGTAATAGPLLRAKKVRFLALAAPQRLTEYPDVPTLAESGGPASMELKTWVALYAPKGVPRQTLERMGADVAKAMVTPDFRERLDSFGFKPWTGSAEDINRAAQAEYDRFQQIIKTAHIGLD